MKKAFIIPMLAIAAFGLVACNNGQPSSSESSTSTKAPFVAETVTIDNKDGLKALWRVGFDNRAVDITVKDASGNPGNPSALVTSGEMTVTSSNTAAVKALGLSLIPVAPGKSTITVAINGKTDTVEVEVKEKRAEAGVDAILQEFANLAKGSYTEESVPCVGVVSRYETFYNAKDKNVTVWIKDAEGTKEIELYKVPGAKGVDLSDLIPGDTVHVEGKIQNYNGTFEYTAAGSITKVDKIARPTPATRPEPTETTIDAIIEKQAKEMGVEYKVEGIWENGKGDDYGNGYLTNPETGKSIQVYGSTATETAIEFNGLTGSPLYVFTNPKDAKTTLKDLKNGMKVTANALNITYVSSDGKKITPEVALVVKKTEAVETKYAASAAAVENGTVELSKTADLAYGEEVTVTATPNEGFKVTKIEVDHGYGKEDITEAKKFKATVSNKVIVTIKTESGDDMSTLKYPGGTTTNMTEHDNATAVGLNASVFTVDAAMGERGDIYPGLNKAGYIALYSKKSAEATGEGSSFTVTVKEGLVIKSITVDYKQNAEYAKVFVGDQTVTGTEGVYTINARSFTVMNGYKSDGTASQQVHVRGIDIIYGEPATPNN